MATSITSASYIVNGRLSVSRVFHELQLHDIPALYQSDSRESCTFQTSVHNSSIKNQHLQW